MSLGIFGGTFDPPHLGHSILAAEAHAQLGLDSVLWVPAGHSPFKQAQALTPIDIRLAMVEAAIGDDAGFALSKVDIERPGPHYTADTIRLLRRRYPEAELIMLVGSDVLEELPEWHQPEVVLSQSRLAVLRRPGVKVNLEVLYRQLPGLSQQITWITAPSIEIASSDIRRRVAQGQPYRYFVRDGVWKIIEGKQLYRGGL